MNINMRSLTAAALLCSVLVLCATQANAQTAVVATCPSGTAVGNTGQKGVPFAIDKNGNICVIGTTTLSGTGANNADAVVSVATGLTPVQGYNFVYNGTTWDRLRGDTTNGAFVNVKTSVLPTGAALDTSITTTNTDLGAPGAVACATDTSSCSLNQFMQRLAQRLSTIVTTLGTPMQATGGTVTANAPVGITPTDRTIASASGASQQIAAANASRHSLTIVNTGNANCGVNPTGGTAAIGGAGTLTLAPLGAYTPRIPSLSAVTVICTAAQPIYGDEN